MILAEFSIIYWVCQFFLFRQLFTGDKTMTNKMLEKGAGFCAEPGGGVE
jgi:hypothetical protein